MLHDELGGSLAMLLLVAMYEEPPETTASPVT
jgi:hypothetical protein